MSDEGKKQMLAMSAGFAAAFAKAGVTPPVKEPGAQAAASAQSVTAAAEQKQGGDGGDFDDNFEGSLFLDEDYQMKEYSFEPEGPVVQCAALQTSATDYDLTGQVVWKISEVLSRYIVRNSDDFEGRDLLELGAGAGLAGLVASHYANVAVLTDGSDIVMKLLRQNVEANGGLEEGLDAALLRWGDKDDIAALQSKYPAGFDIIIGADIMQWTASLDALFKTVNALLAPRPGSVFIAAFVCRALYSMDQALKAAADNNVVYSTGPPEEFMPDPIYTAEERAEQDYRFYIFRRKTRSDS